MQILLIHILALCTLAYSAYNYIPIEVDSNGDMELLNIPVKKWVRPMPRNQLPDQSHLQRLAYGDLVPRDNYVATRRASYAKRNIYGRII